MNPTMLMLFRRVIIAILSTTRSKALYSIFFLSRNFSREKTEARKSFHIAVKDSRYKAIYIMKRPKKEPKFVLGESSKYFGLPPHCELPLRVQSLASLCLHQTI